MKEGYKIPFFSTPYRKNNKSALNNNEFVTKEIEELLTSGRIVETPYTSHVVNPLSVSEQSGRKKRLI